MNRAKLGMAEKLFLQQYPGGFNHPAMIEIGKKHKMEKTVEFARNSFGEDKFFHLGEMTENMIRMVTRSSMVSVFEKPRFRDTLRAFTPDQKQFLAGSLYEMLHGNQEKGFNMMTDLLSDEKLAKWTLLTVYGAYYKPDYEVFCKPTTVKAAINFFELENLVYRARPDWDFYRIYRDAINEMKSCVKNESLKSSNAAFSGFLMMVMGL